MYINKLIKKQVLLAITSLFLIAIIVFGSSLAFFEKSVSNSTDQTISVGDLNIIFTGGSEINSSGLVAMSDETALSKTDNVYTFSIKNNGTLSYVYDISLITNPSYLEGGNDYNSERKLLDLKYLRYQLNSETIKNIPSQSKIHSNVIAPGETQNYTLRIWLKDAERYQLPNEILNQELHLNIIIDGEVGTEPNNISNNPRFKEAILAENEVVEPLSTPADEEPYETESELSATPDDYGSSLYFRGAVQNNYVEYANMCWRIVRVTGNDAVKLVLYNYNGLTDSNNTPASQTPCAEPMTNETYNWGFARYDGNTSQVKFNTYSSYNAYIGFMYGTLGGSSYEEEHANTYKSTILQALEKWYENVLSVQSDFNSDSLADVIWCNDKSISSGGLGYGTLTITSTTTYYSAYSRFLNIPSPTLICPTDSNGGKLSKFTVDDITNGNGNLKYKIGLLTADEIAYASAADPSDGDDLMETTYITENAARDFWTLTPVYAGYNDIRVYILENDREDHEDDFYLTEDTVSSESYLRPSIAISPNATVTGTGTSTDPYKIDK